MLRRSLTFGAPVYIQLCDNSRVDIHKSLVRAGVGFGIKVELGFAVNEMPVTKFQYLIDEHFKKISANYQSVLAGQVYDQNFNKVVKVVAGRKYIVAGMMKNGYIKPEPKYNNGFRLNGMQGNYKGGLQWGGEKF